MQQILAILVTEPEFAKGRGVFERGLPGVVFMPAPANEPALAAHAVESKAFGVVLGVERYGDALYESLPIGGIIARFGVGHDGVDKAKAREKGLYVTNTPGALDTSVAENTIFLVGSLARSIPAHAHEMQIRNWSPRRGVELRGKNLSLIGFGRIAREVARIAARGFGMNVTACGTVIRDEQSRFAHVLREQNGVEVNLTQSLDEALSSGDFVALHLPLSSNTRSLIGAREMSIMPLGSYLVNTARGGIVDEVALYDALESGHLAGAGIDVFKSEPYEPAQPGKDLRSLSNCIMTPHISSNTDLSNQRMAEMCMANIRALLEGRHADMTTV